MFACSLVDFVVQTPSRPMGIVMGSLGPAELVVIAIVAIVVFGPKRLPEIARKASEFLKLARDATQSLTNAIDTEYEGVAAPLKDLKSEYEATLQTIKTITPATPYASYRLPDGTPSTTNPETMAGTEQTSDNEEPPNQDEPSNSETEDAGVHSDERISGFDATKKAVRASAPATPHASFKLPDGADTHDAASEVSAGEHNVSEELGPVNDSSPREHPHEDSERTTPEIDER